MVGGEVFGSPLLSKKMNKTAYIVMMALLMMGCKSKAVTVIDTTRHVDSITAMSSVSARQLESVETWETIVMRPDTLGRLVVTSRDIVRHVSKATEKATDTASTHLQVQVEEKDVTKVEKTAEPTQTRGKGLVGFGIGIWVTLSALVVLLIVYLIRKGKGRWI